MLDILVPEIVLNGAGVMPGIGEFEPDAVAQHVAGWVEQMRLPRRLREIGVREDQLPELSTLAFASRTVRNNAKPVADAEQIETLLRQAW